MKKMVRNGLRAAWVVGLACQLAACAPSPDDDVTGEEQVAGEMTAASASKNVGIYALGPFSTANPTPAQQKQIAQAGQDLGAAGFDTVILASMHISSTGDINFNDTAMASGGSVSTDLDPNLATVLGDMKTQGQVKQILMSFGGGGCFSGQAIGYWDFLHLKDLIAKYPDPANNPFFQNLAAILGAFPIDGVDIDLEVYSDPLCENGFGASYSEFTSTLTTLTGWLNGRGALTTIAPYDSFSFWADLLVATNSGGTQQMAWVNLQGGELSPADVGGFVQALQGKSIGVSDLDGFVLAGMQISQGDTASEVQNGFAPLGQSTPDVGGGWLWNFSSFAPGQSSAFATAVRQGLAGKPSP